METRMKRDSFFCYSFKVTALTRIISSCRRILKELKIKSLEMMTKRRDVFSKLNYKTKIKKWCYRPVDICLIVAQAGWKVKAWQRWHLSRFFWVYSLILIQYSKRDGDKQNDFQDINSSSSSIFLWHVTLY